MKIHKPLLEYMIPDDYDLEGLDGKDTITKFFKWAVKTLGEQEVESLFNSKDAMMLAGLIGLFRTKYVEIKAFNDDEYIKIFRGFGFNTSPKKILTQCTKSDINRLNLRSDGVKSAFYIIQCVAMYSNEPGKFVIPGYVSDLFKGDRMSLVIGNPILFQKYRVSPEVTTSGDATRTSIEWAEGITDITIVNSSYFASSHHEKLIVPKSVTF